MTKFVKWQRSDDGHGQSHCGRYSFSPNYCGTTRPEDYQLWFFPTGKRGGALGHERIGNMIATQAECKERAEVHAAAIRSRNSGGQK